MDIQALVDGIHSHFLGDAPLLAALGGAGSSVTSNARMFDTKADDDVESPYVVYQQIAGIIDQTFTSDGELTTWQFSIFNKTSSPLDKTTINDVFKKLTEAYDDTTTLTVSGYKVIAVTRMTFGFVPTEDDIQMHVVDYQIQIELN